MRCGGDGLISVCEIQSSFRKTAALVALPLHPGFPQRNGAQCQVGQGARPKYS